MGQKIQTPLPILQMSYLTTVNLEIEPLQGSIPSGSEGMVLSVLTSRFI